MAHNESLTTDEILAKLDQTSRKARVVSLGLTLILLLILSIVAFATYQVYHYSTILQDQADDLSNKVEALRKEEEDLKAKVEEAKKLCDADPNCVEVAKALDKIDSNTEIVSTSITPTPAPSRIPIKINSPTANAQSKPSDNSPSTIYVQIADKNHRDSARKKIQQIAGGNFRFPGIELVERKIPKTQVRYFHVGDKAKAEEIVGRLSGADIPASIVFTSIKAPQNQLEIWFANDAFHQ